MSAAARRLAALLLVLAVAGELLELGRAWSSCRAVGGAYVRGVLWFECVRPEITIHAPR